ncbi:hypothetical protein BDR26DRAFT_1005534 [Obelidium mucronatum]|nr:hypothetical protein BDR26DRAFT_1005534 [Obelidium mucronatum]
MDTSSQSAPTPSFTTRFTASLSKQSLSLNLFGKTASQRGKEYAATLAVKQSQPEAISGSSSISASDSRSRRNSEAVRQPEVGSSPSVTLSQRRVSAAAPKNSTTQSSASPPLPPSQRRSVSVRPNLKPSSTEAPSVAPVATTSHRQSISMQRTTSLNGSVSSQSSAMRKQSIAAREDKRKSSSEAGPPVPAAITRKQSIHNAPSMKIRRSESVPASNTAILSAAADATQATNQGTGASPEISSAMMDSLVQELNNTVAIQRTRLDHATQELEIRDSKIAALEHELSTTLQFKNETIDSLRRQLNLKETTLQTLNQQIDALSKDISTSAIELVKQVAAKDDEIKALALQLEETRTAHEKTVRSLESSLIARETEAVEHSKELEELSIQMHLALQNNSLKAAQQTEQMEKAISESSSQKEEISSLKQELAHLQELHSHTVSDFESREKRYLGQVAELDDIKKDMLNAIDSDTKTIGSLKTELARTRRESESHLARLTRLESVSSSSKNGSVCDVESDVIRSSSSVDVPRDIENPYELAQAKDIELIAAQNELEVLFSEMKNMEDSFTKTVQGLQFQLQESQNNLEELKRSALVDQIRTAQATEERSTQATDYRDSIIIDLQNQLAFLKKRISSQSALKQSFRISSDSRLDSPTDSSATHIQFSGRPTPPLTPTQERSPTQVKMDLETIKISAKQITRAYKFNQFTKTDSLLVQALDVIRRLDTAVSSALELTNMETSSSTSLNNTFTSLYPSSPLSPIDNSFSSRRSSSFSGVFASFKQQPKDTRRESGDKARSSTTIITPNSALMKAIEEIQTAKQSLALLSEDLRREKTQIGLAAQEARIFVLWIQNLENDITRIQSYLVV